MRDKKRFLSVMLLTTAMLFAGGCGNQVQPVSAEPSETVKEADTEDSLEPTSSPAEEPEESMESSEEEDNSEKEADTTEEEGGQDSEYEIISLEDTVMYAAADCDIMSDAGAQYDIVGSLSYAQEVTVNGKVEAGEDVLWYVIKTEDGSRQMVRADMLRGTKPAVQTASGSGSGSNSGGSTGDAGGTGNSQTASTTAPAPAEPVATPAPAPEPAPAEPVVSPAPTPEPAPVHTHSWNAHYVETQVWVPNVVWIPNIVVVEDYETQTISYIVYTCNCGFETTDRSALDEHAWNHIYADEIDNYWFKTITNEQQVLVGTHEEDHGHEEDQGHYETSTYVDYYYCEGCGAIQ